MELFEGAVCGLVDISGYMSDSVLASVCPSQPPVFLLAPHLARAEISFMPCSPGEPRFLEPGEYHSLHVEGSWKNFPCLLAQQPEAIWSRGPPWRWAFVFFSLVYLRECRRVTKLPLGNTWLSGSYWRTKRDSEQLSADWPWPGTVVDACNPTALGG